MRSPRVDREYRGEVTGAHSPDGFRHAGDGSMRIRFGTILLVLLVALSILVTAPTLARPSDIDAIENRFNVLYARGDYAGALAEGQKLEAAVKARVGVNHPGYASVLNNLANVYASQGKYAWRWRNRRGPWLLLPFAWRGHDAKSSSARSPAHGNRRKPRRRRMWLRPARGRAPSTAHKNSAPTQQDCIGVP